MECEVRHVTEEEKDILQEIMNIAFGKAAADLAEVINIFVVLSVPSIQILKGADLPGYLHGEILDSSNISIVEQNFRGEFSGSAFLVFPAGAGKELITLLEADNEEIFESDSIDLLEKETLMEVGNILIAACVGKMSELLGDVVTYSPPKVVVENHPHEIIPNNLFDPEYSAIVMKTLFRFEDRDVNGFLFLVTTHNSIAWLKESLARFLEQYE
ncbi:MAG TPA: chemotaxis protein CheC [Geobacteraceae bacterium]|nr:chemotaxis protein CheC [Geobacteraceae bacterium]